VPPKDFIPLLEETGLIVRVGSWVTAEVCRQIGLWMRSSIGPVQVSANVSGRQFIEGDLDEDVRKALAANGIPGELLELELTESSLMGNTERTIASMQSLKSLGVRISIDDFGTGYSSLAYLRRFLSTYEDRTSPSSATSRAIPTMPRSCWPSSAWPTA